MTWFVESPWPSLTLGIAIEVVLAIVLVRTGRAVIIAAMVGVLALTAGMLVLERLIVTEREAVEDTLDGVASALATNDPPQVLAYFAPTSPRRAEVQSVLSRVKVNAAHIGGDLEIRLNHLTNPPSASTVFTARLEATDTRGEIPLEHFIHKFNVTLHWVDDRWLIYDYADAGTYGGSQSGGNQISDSAGLRGS